MSLNLVFSQPPSWIVLFGKDLMARVVATDAYAWARYIVIEGGTELLDRGLVFAKEWSARCVLIPF